MAKAPTIKKANVVSSTPIDERGSILEDVKIEIDYSIIEHFSKYLYSSPNKAIEELVSNSFDASATQTYVYIPGSFTDSSVLVWDNGVSMSKDGLHKLWWIAQSPKKEVDRLAIVTHENGTTENRAMIGKFGIGKLASYAVGHRITHLCRQGDVFLRISVDYRDVPHLQDGQDRQQYVASIVTLSEPEARAYAVSLFRPDVSPEVLTHNWQTAQWTLAVIDELKPVTLTEGRLRWVIGNGMPLRPDFRVWLNDAEVSSKLAKGALFEWDISEPQFLEQFASDWRVASSAGRVNGNHILLPADDRPESRALELPNLGKVTAKAYLFAQSLLRRDDVEEEARSYGFFVMVRGRLINSQNEKVGLTDPSFGAFYRSQFVIYADGLDSDLLADREHWQSDTLKTREFAVLRDALYKTARKMLERYDTTREQERESASLLPIDSRDFFREPMTALLLRHGDDSPTPFDPSTAARIERVPLDPDSPIATLNYEEGGFTVNSAHPLMTSVQEKIGSGKKAREVLRALDLFAVSERIFEGYLYDLGLPDEQIERILTWRDGLLRAMALRYSDAPIDEVVNEALQASYGGNKPFETALAKLFRLMGFEADRDGASGQKDVLVVAPIGEKHYRFTVEAKGSIGAIENDAAEVSAAAAHRAAANAQHAIIVAREFKGFGRDPKGHPAILNECESTSGVSIVTVQALGTLVEVMRRYSYPLEDVLPLLAIIESPEEKMNRINELKDPTDNFDYRGVLDEIWRRQQGEAVGDQVPYRTVWQAGPDRWGVPKFEDFLRRLRAIDTFSGGLLHVSEQESTVTLRQSPELVADRIQQSVDFHRLPMRTRASAE